MDLSQVTPGSSVLYFVLAVRADNSGASQLVNLGTGSVTFLISSVTVTIGSGAPISLPSSTITYGAQVRHISELSFGSDLHVHPKQT